MENSPIDTVSLIKTLAERGDLLAVAVVIIVLALIAWIKHGGASVTFRGASASADPQGLTNTVAAVADKLDQIDMRLTRVEADFEHLPDSEDYHTLEVSLARLTERMVSISDTVMATNRGQRRIEDIILNIATKG